MTIINGAIQTTESSMAREFAVVRNAIRGGIKRFRACPDPSPSGNLANLYDGFAGQLDPDHGSITPILNLIRAESIVLTGITAASYKS
ncbi:MAG: hypothetical protein FWE61_06995, partial [Micrococcales bacterium]|nr:hypothetical protein [Micrococcales bacterium]